MTKDEVKRLLSKIDNVEDSCLITLGLDSGCRVSEIVRTRNNQGAESKGILVNHISFEEGTIEIWDQKKRQWRMVIVTSKTMQTIKMYLKSKQVQTPELFSFSGRTANRRLKKWCGMAEIDPQKQHWHILRHTYVVLSRLAGRDLKAVQQQTGDSVRTLLRVYSTLTLEERKEIAEQNPILPD